MIAITIKTENAAFAGEARIQETARILQELAAKIELRNEIESAPLFDINGNNVGELTVSA